MSYLHLVINHGCPIWTPLGLGKLSSQSAGQASLQRLKDTDTQNTAAPVQSGHWFGAWRTEWLMWEPRVPESERSLLSFLLAKETAAPQIL